jgi:hypothetical protein
LLLVISKGNSMLGPALGQNCIHPVAFFTKALVTDVQPVDFFT